MSVDLDKLFPAAPPVVRSPRVGTNKTNHKGLISNGGSTIDDVKTRWAAVYTLELRGLDKKEIASALGLSDTHVSKITRDPRYIAYREEHLATLDHEFVEMKPLAFQALKNGLGSRDENTALRASEQWFKGAGFGGFSKQEQPTNNVTAEDIAQQLLQAVQVNVNVTVEK